MSQYAACVDTEAFGASRVIFEALVGQLADPDGVGQATHAELEELLTTRSRELMRQLLQDHLDLRAQREQRLDDVADAGQVARSAVETGHTRALATVFGQVTVTRLGYRRRGHANLYPADGQLNLPVEKHSHGLRHLAALEAARGSFDDTAEAIERATGVRLGKRQVEELAERAAADFEDFYAQHRVSAGAGRDVLVLSADGKGIVMRPDALRPATAEAAASSTTKLATRLSKGEKRNRKRLAEVGAVYDAEPVVRTPTDILTRSEDTEGAEPPEAPVAANKWLTASVTHDAATVISRLFDEACRRDPDHGRSWIALVDGNNHQIDRIQAEAAQRGVEVSILCDFIHVLEYLSAPRGALLYPPLSGEGLEEISLGLMAYLGSKGCQGENSMPGNQRSCPGVWDEALRGPRDKEKAGLPEVQSPEGASRTPAGKTPETGAAPAAESRSICRNPPGYGAMPSEGIQGDEWSS